MNMYIKSVKITNWNYLQFKDQIFFKKGINLILGKNGSGKTSLLQLIQGIFLKTNQSLSEEFRLKDNGLELVKVKIDNEGEELDIINSKQNDSGVWNENILKFENIRFIASSRSITNTKNATNSFKNLYDDNLEVNVGKEIDVAEEFNRMMHKELYKIIMDKIADGDQCLLEIQEDYQNGLIDFEKKIKITLDKDNIVTFIDHKGREVSINNLSSGEKEYIYFYSFLRRIREDEGKIILIDEPELHLHSNQIRKLCDLINNLGVKNQIIIATHSGEVLQYFMSRSNLTLISKDRIKNINDLERMKETIDDTGLPVDPSVFTAHWICAENDPNKIISNSGLTTPEILGKIFGTDIERRYWSFGSNKELSTSYGEGIKVVFSKDVKITPILDGDKLFKSSDDFVARIIPKPKINLAFFPFWELENIFLHTDLLDFLIDEKEGKSGSEQFWEKIKLDKERLLNQIKKTIIKNYFRKYSLDKYIKSSPEKDCVRWKEEIVKDNIDVSSINIEFESIIDDKDWKWIPGKEALKLVIELQGNYWDKFKNLKNNEIKEILEKDKDVKIFFEEVLKTTKEIESNNI
ncbi:MAG: AAA family ATPase [Bacilli bacterium]|nr:AAA family ATPase [Bacilli bacterium]